MEYRNPESVLINLAASLVRQALTICDDLGLLEPACHLQMGLDLIDNPNVRRLTSRDPGRLQ